MLALLVLIFLSDDRSMLVKRSLMILSLISHHQTHFTSKWLQIEIKWKKTLQVSAWTIALGNFNHLSASFVAKKFQENTT